MRPRVISHMVSTADGKTDPRRLGGNVSSDYELTAKELGGDAWLCGRATMAKDFAKYQDARLFTSTSGSRAGARAAHVAEKASSYAIAADTLGKLSWKTNEIDGDHLICLVSESAPADYLTLLEGRGISYVVAGASEIDFARGLEILGASFGIRTVLLEGGGIVNGALVDAGVLDEVSLLVVPGIDGRAGVSAVFEGRDTDAAPVHLALRSVDQRDGGILWLRYDVVKSE
jgi:2,5-diamino-6-(ribosylamino)-4(3H)-pyrimidinone 5'-phosphate reductase